MLERSLQEVRKKIQKAIKGMQDPSRKDSKRAQFLLWIMKSFESLPTSIDKHDTDKWNIIDGTSVDDIINAFSSCLCRFLNGKRIEIESSYNEDKYTARLLEAEGKSENNLHERMIELIFAVNCRDKQYYEGPFLQQASR
jgi:hypothetical protein